MDMIEKLKENQAKFYKLEPEEQAFLKSLPDDSIQIMQDGGDWYGLQSPNFEKYNRYRISPDYKPEPVNLIIGRDYKITPIHVDGNLREGTYTISESDFNRFTKVAQFTVAGYAYSTKYYTFELIPEPEIITCPVDERNGNLFFREYGGRRLLHKALSRANFIRCIDKDGNICATRTAYTIGDTPAKWPAFVVFKKS